MDVDRRRKQRKQQYPNLQNWRVLDKYARRSNAVTRKNRTAKEWNSIAEPDGQGPQNQVWYVYAFDPGKEEYVPVEEKVSIGTGSVLGMGAGAWSGKIALSIAGVSGLSAAGITSGLSAIGGSMLGGIVVLAAIPVAGALAGAGIGYGGYKTYQWWINRTDEDSNPER